MWTNVPFLPIELVFQEEMICAMTNTLIPMMRKAMCALPVFQSLRNLHRKKLRATISRISLSAHGVLTASRPGRITKLTNRDLQPPHETSTSL